MPNLIDVPIVRETLGRLAIGEPTDHQAVTVVPLFSTDAIEPDWLTIVEARESMTITEASEAGAVQSLRVDNAADRPVLLLDGIELIGGNQNRVLNTTVLVGARRTVFIPVSCVEARRWAYGARYLADSGVALFASLRGEKAARVSASLRENRAYVGDQGQLWDDLASRARAHRVAHPAGAMHAVYERYASQLTEGGAVLAAKPGQVGALVYLTGEWIGLDLLAAPGLFARAWPALCAGYVADAIGRDGGPPPGIAPATIIRLLLTTPVETAPGVDMGRAYRFEGGRVSGTVLVVDDMVARLMAFSSRVTI